MNIARSGVSPKITRWSLRTILRRAPRWQQAWASVRSARRLATVKPKRRKPPDERLGHWHCVGGPFGFTTPKPSSCAAKLQNHLQNQLGFWQYQALGNHSTLGDTMKASSLSFQAAVLLVLIGMGWGIAMA